MTRSTTAAKAAAALFPDLFAVWRPSLRRWQMLRTVRVADGSVTAFRPAWGPWVSATHHRHKSQDGPVTTAGSFMGASAKPRRSCVFLGDRRVEFNRVGEHFTVQELDDRGMTMRRVPVLDFVCWRSLPRTGV